MDKEKILKEVKNNFNNDLNNNEIIFMNVSGSYLFGTNNENSDIDIKCLTKNSDNRVLCTTEQNKKNTKEDIDLELINLETFHRNFQNSKVLAVEMFFAIKNNSNELINNLNETQLILNKYKDFKINTNDFQQLVISNTSLYINRKKRAEEFIKIFNFISNIKIEEKYWKFHEYIYLVEEFIKENDFKYSYIEKSKSRTLLKFSSFEKDNTKNKLITNILLSAKFSYIIDELNKIKEKYEAFLNPKFIFKLLSTNVRLIKEIEELEKTNNLIYPLSYKKELLEIKEGKKYEEEIYKYINENIDKYLKKNEKKTVLNEDINMF
jgi:predicted nucleotidyltransferase